MRNNNNSNLILYFNRTGWQSQLKHSSTRNSNKEWNNTGGYPTSRICIAEIRFVEKSHQSDL